MNNSAWLTARESIKNKISHQNYKTWVEPLKVIEIDETKLKLGVMSSFHRDWIKDKFSRLIRDEISTAFGKEVMLELDVIEDNKIAEVKHSTFKNDVINRGIIIGEELNSEYTFDKFVVGPSNQFVYAASRAIADKDAQAKIYNPLFIYGGVGLGKTHLLNAIGNYLVENNPGARICYMTSEKFTNEMINHIRYKRMDQFREKYRNSCEVLLIDDIQFIAGKETTQDEFFHTFNSLYNAGKQIVVTSDSVPKNISGLEKRLRTRFEWGLIADIQPPEIETRIAILRNKADNFGITLPQDVAMYIATNVKSNVRELEGCLIKLKAQSTLDARMIDLSYAKEILENVMLIKKTTITINMVFKIVASKYGIKISDLKSEKKARILSLPRQIAMYLSRMYTKASYPEIGKESGGKDHSTVIYACRKIRAEMAKDKDLAKRIYELEAIISEL